MCGSSLHSWGTYCVNIEKMCVPSGLSVLSSVVGMTPSLNGSSAGRPSRASWNARSMNSIVGDISTEPVWCSAIPSLGSAVKLGSSASARLILTTPERVFHRSMSVDEVLGQLGARQLLEEGGLGVQARHDQRRPQLLAADEDDAGRATVAGRDTLSTRASVRISAPNARAERAIAADTAPMPPSG